MAEAPDASGIVLLAGLGVEVGLAYAPYGQGESLVTPLQMALVAATVDVLSKDRRGKQEQKKSCNFSHWRTSTWPLTNTIGAP